MRGSKGRIKTVVSRFWFRRAMSSTRLRVLVVRHVSSCLGVAGNVGMDDGGCGCEIGGKRV